ncbi:interferon gamma-like [Acanthopagrus latus]|uniref:Interferon gamma n=1 Tax=Acanthopagrus latus TaxID=8177 RepID=A0A6B9RHD2_ACALA|nr:interferon gamma-like [Acanthopagrus latus]QHI00133.1 interferon gamma [Acanthopagrus latus]
MVSAVRAAICLILMVVLCQVRGAYIPPKMNQTIQSLLRHYRIDDEQRFDGNKVFPKEPPAGKMETKLLFMGGILDTYEKLLGHMLKQQPTASPQTASISTDSYDRAGPSGDVRDDLKFILEKVRELKKKKFHEQEMILRGLQDLKHVQMDNLVVQSKALWELPWLYEEASSLSDNSKMRRRRRRQARKSQLRG